MFSSFIRSIRGAALVVALGLVISSAVNAQSNTAGNIAGRAAVGDTVTIENPKTGFARIVTVGRSGRFSVRSLPPGVYRVTVKDTSGNAYKTQGVAVRVGTTSTARWPEERELEEVPDGT